jgi:predicted Zn-dependent protease
MVSSADDLRALLERALSFTNADEAEASVHMASEANLRFANNQPTTNGMARDTSLHVRCTFGRRVGRATTSQTDDASLQRTVERAERIAKLSPESPEEMPRLGEQSYATPPSWDERTATLAPESRSAVARDAIAAAREADLDAAGYIEDGWAVQAFANSAGGFGYHRQTGASYSITARTRHEGGSGWSAAESQRAERVDGRSVTDRAIRKALGSRSPVELAPGAYPVILEPSAMGDMVNLYFSSLDRRSADEGRSFFSDPARGTKLGDQLFGESISVYSDPTDDRAPSTPWGEDGLPLARTEWARNGLQKNLFVSRYWAQERGLTPVPRGTNLIMEGGTASLDDLVASMSYGLVVTSFWYIRTVDPQTILHTGLTRDGLFLVENGEITRPVVNFRWNESPAAVFRAIEAMTPGERVVTREGYLPIVAPAAKVGEFRFTSVSPSV